jgi:ribose transport system substrate-binding protein
MIAKGGPQDVAAGSPAGWHGWAAIDGINRLFNNEKQVDPGIGYELIDKDHPSPTVPYEGNKRSLGWKENYRKIWGLAGA